jgi:hypothetical protein
MKKNGLVKKTIFAKTLLIIFLFSWPVCTFSQNTQLNIGNFSFSLSPKILKDGSITDAGFGFNYTEQLGGELRLRYIATSKNEDLFDVKDSLNAVSENIFEIFLLPLEYSFIRNTNNRLWFGGGIYYEYDNLNEKGFFNMPVLETLIPPRERVNSYTNEFSMHIMGPLLDTGYRHNWEKFVMSISGGIVPVFFLHSTQKTKIIPLLDPQTAEYTQNTWGSPYFYINLDTVILKYINLVFLYDLSKLTYKVLDFDSNLAWINPEQNVTIQILKTEASLLLPLGGSMRFQIGYGFKFDYTRFGSGSIVENNRQYVILTVKKI